MRRGKIDPLGRQLVVGIAVGRIAVGAGTFLATGPALRALGLGQEPAADARALGKVLGARDLAVGLLTVAARDDRAALRAMALTAATLDAADAAGFTFAAAEPETRRGGVLGVVSAAGAALLGFWAWRRLA
jgi:hypothetical protein